MPKPKPVEAYNYYNPQKAQKKESGLYEMILTVLNQEIQNFIESLTIRDEDECLRFSTLKDLFEKYPATMPSQQIFEYLLAMRECDNDEKGEANILRTLTLHDISFRDICQLQKSKEGIASSKGFVRFFQKHPEVAAMIKVVKTLTPDSVKYMNLSLFDFPNLSFEK